MAHSPADVVATLIGRISEGRWTELAPLYADRAVVEHPLQRSSIVGRRAVADRFAGAAAAGVRLEAFDVVLHETTDPEVVVAEYGYRHPGFTSANVQVVRVRDGLITHSRDYHDHLRMAAARGDSTGLAAPYEPSPAGPPPEAPGGSPSAVVLQLLTSPLDARADLYTEDAFVAHPFHPTTPALKGREELRKHFASAGNPELEPRNVAFHQGKDPELVITEFEYAGTTGNGNPVLATNILITRVRNGRIAESRDYADHVAFAAAAGRLPELFAAAQSAVRPARS